MFGGSDPVGGAIAGSSKAVVSGSIRDPVCPSGREELNYWTKHRSCAEAVRRVNRITRGWSNTYHYGHNTRVFGRQQVWLKNRVRRWLWRKYDCTHGLFSFFTDERLLGQYQLWPLPRTCAWRR